MSNYMIINENEIKEKDTDHVFRIASMDQAKKLCKDLNNGKGFDGWTPAFLFNPSHVFGDWR